VVDGAEMDCGSGLLLLITRAMRRLEVGELLVVRSAEASVVTDLPVWADLAGHDLSAQLAESGSGPWWFGVTKCAPATVGEIVGKAVGETAFSTGERTPVGHRLWVYTNFDCNLACSYCCAQSSPAAAARRMDVATATEAFSQFRASRGREVFLTGGEPFMHPELGDLVEAAAGLERTILTNAMILSRGRRRETLDALDRDVVLQVSLDSATPEVHDRQRGDGSWAKALRGIEDARGFGFRVRVAATLYEEDRHRVGSLHERLDEIGIDAADRLIRPVAQEGFATTGLPVSLDSLEPEPTITADGAWWHPVAVTNPNLRIADRPLPLDEFFAGVRDTMAVQDAAARAGRAVFRCA
jgi:organic radical activating enzyme/TusA-related sulfurtransferase